MSQMAVTARRTQQERRAQTRARLLEATIQSLLDVGYQATTTRRVAHLAGVSTGAQAHHYPSRLDLVVAAVEELGRQRLADLRSAAAGLPEGEDRLTGLLDLLWADFSSPLFAVWAKLWVAAADDAELAARLESIERDVNREIRDFGFEVFGPLNEDDATFVRRLRVAISTIRGLALARAFEPGGAERAEASWPDHRRELVLLLLRR